MGYYMLFLKTVISLFIICIICLNFVNIRYKFLYFIQFGIFLLFDNI